MTTRLRFLQRLLLLLPLLWLTLLALPAGAQAAAMPPCHHAQMQAGVAHAAHRAGMEVGACASQAHGGGRHHGHDHSHCTNCPACCAAVALAPAPLSAPPAAGPAFVAIPFRAGHVPSVDPALPERPPRQHLA